jgi:hypothetical protein
LEMVTCARAEGADPKQKTAKATVHPCKQWLGAQGRAEPMA